MHVAYVTLHMHVICCDCTEFQDEILLRGEECKTRGNSNFLKNGKMVISVKILNFLDLGRRNGLHRWNRLTKSSYHDEFRRIPR